MNKNRIRILLLILFIIIPLFSCQLSETEDITYRLNFTQEESEWLIDAGKITLGFFPFFPILRVDEESMYSQYVYSLFKMIEKRSGIKFNFKFYKSLSDLLEQAESKEVDMIIHVGDTPKRREFLIFSRPIIAVPCIAVTLTNPPPKGLSNDITLKDLMGRKVAITKGFPIEEIIETDYPDIIIVPVKNDREGLLKLEMREVDVLITFLAGVSYYVGEMGLTNLRASEIPEFRINYGIGTRKNLPILADIIQKVLDSFSTEEILNLYNKRASIAAPPFYESTTFKQLVLFILAGIFLTTIVLVIFIWNNIVRKKTDYQITQLLSEKNKQAAVFNSISSVIIIIDSLGKISSMNNMAVDLSNTEQVEQYENKFFWEVFPFLEEYRYYFYDVIKNKKPLEYFRKIHKRACL